MAKVLQPGTSHVLSLSALYDQWVAEGQINDDKAQREVLAALEALRRALLRQKSSGLFKKPPKGIYVWGGVGRGKSMLMQLFYDHAPIEKKQRVHFHAFMQDAYARIHKIRQEGQRGGSHIKGGGADPVVILAQQIAKETSLLCFDELQATDVADATLLYRLFSQLFDAGVIVVSTSNHPPASLYTGGVQRERFNKFIALIEAHMQVISLSSPQDYRHTKMQAMTESYVWPLGKKADAFIANVIHELCMDKHPKKGSVSVKGRTLKFDLYDDSIGKFSFDELCGKALGPADYLEFAKTLDTVIVTGIPKLPPEKRNEAKRFVTLIDALYERKVKLLATAETTPDEIYGDGDGAFEFKRTVSRLKEMQSAEWLSR